MDSDRAQLKMAHPRREAILKVAAEIQREEMRIKELAMRKQDLAKQIDQQSPNEPETQRMKADLEESKRTRENRFTEDEANLERQLQRLRKEHNDFLTQNREQLADLESQSVAALRREQQKIEGEIKKADDRLQELEKSPFDGPTLPLPAVAGSGQQQSSETSQPQTSQADAGLPSETPGDDITRRDYSGHETLINDNVTNGNPSDVPPIHHDPIAEKQKVTATQKDRVTGIKPINRTFPNVVSAYGDWCELFCSICTSNVNSANRYFRAWSGLRKHIELAHEEEFRASSDQDLLDSCILRRFDKADVQRMRRHEQPRKPIVKTTKKEEDTKPGHEVGEAPATGGHVEGGGRGEDECAIVVATRASKKQEVAPPPTEYNKTAIPDVQDEEDEDDRQIIPGRRRRSAAAIVHAHDIEGTTGGGEGTARPNKRNEPVAQKSLRDIADAPEEDEDYDDDDDYDSSDAPGNIIPFKTEYARINCKYCNANASIETQDFFDGLDGMQDHLISSHKSEMPAAVPAFRPQKDILRHCEVEKISLEQLELLVSDEIPNERRFPPFGKKANKRKAPAKGAGNLTASERDVVTAAEGRTDAPPQFVAPLAPMVPSSTTAPTESSLRKLQTLDASAASQIKRLPQTSNSAAPNDPRRRTLKKLKQPSTRTSGHKPPPPTPPFGPLFTPSSAERAPAVGPVSVVQSTRLTQLARPALSAQDLQQRRTTFGANPLNRSLSLAHSNSPSNRSPPPKVLGSSNASRQPAPKNPANDPFNRWSTGDQGVGRGVRRA